MEQSFTKKAVQRYLILMHELATRIDLVAQACDGKLNLTPPFAREYAYLQFRRMCELIALGCLQLHGDLPSAQTQTAQREWNAEKIMKLLHNSHSHAFPQSVTRSKGSKGWNIQGNSKPGALTRDEFKKLYSECGDILHRGTIRSLEMGSGITDKDYQKVISWQRKVVDLMNEHLVVKVSGVSFCLISLRTESGSPECSIFTKNKNGGLDVHTEKMKL